MSTPPKEGIPYDETIARLMKILDPKSGDFYSHDQLRAICQPCSEARYQGVKSAFRRYLWRVKGLQASGEGKARGRGLAILKGREHGEYVDGQLHQVRRKVKRTAASAKVVDTTDFNEAEKGQHNIRRRETRALVDAAIKATKAIGSPPPATGADGVRLH